MHSGTHLHLEIWKGGRQIDPSTLGPNGLLMGTSQGIDQSSSTATGQPYQGTSTSGETPDYINQILNQASALTTPNENVATGMSLLSQIYSGNTSSITEAFSKIGTSLGLTPGQVQTGMSGTYSPISLSNTPSGIFGSAPGLAQYLSSNGRGLNKLS